MTWLTSKIQAADIPVLTKIGNASRLKDYLDVGYRLKRGPSSGTISNAIPIGSNPSDWAESKLMRKGIEFGGRGVLTPSGRSIYKGLNVFPGRLIGSSMGKWDQSTEPSSLNLYSYQSLFDYERLFVSREIAQLPTIAPVTADVIFNNTVILIQLRERFPLNGWVLSRPVMFAAATCLRATVIEDLVCHWYPKNLGLLPMPTSILPSDLDALQNATRVLISADENIANQWRSVEAAILGQSTKSVSQLIAEGSPLVVDLILPTGEPEADLPSLIAITDSGLSADHGEFNLIVPNTDVREILWYLIEVGSNGNTVELPLRFIGECQIPIDNIPAIAEAIRAVRLGNTAEEFEASRIAIDTLSARLLGLSDDDLRHIQERFITDPFLSQIRPMWAHRGLHMQGYIDHSGGDRFR